MPEKKRLGCVGVTVALASLMFLTGLAVGAGAPSHGAKALSNPGPGAGAHAFVSPPFVRKMVSQQFSGTTQVYDVASIGRQVLSAVVLTNGSYGLRLSDTKTNTSKFLGVTPGGSSNYPQSIVAAGGEFFVAFLNGTTLTSTAEEVSTSGTVTVPPLSFPLPQIGWAFIYGNTTTLYASAGGGLVEFNPTTYATINKFLTYNAAIDAFALVPIGPLLYLAGTYSGVYTGSLFFGTYNTTTNVTKSITPIRYYARNIYGDFTTLAMKGGDLYMGGGTFILDPSPFNQSNLEGLLFRYSLATGTLTNLSSHLPAYNAWAWAIKAGKTGLFIYTGNYAVTSTTTIYTAGFYILYSGTKLTNITSDFPRNFLGDFSLVTSVSGGFVYVGGDNTASHLAEMVALQV